MDIEMQKVEAKTTPSMYHVVPTTVCFESISYSVKDKHNPSGMKRILKDISGIVKSGEILFMMGPSGAGKSTLLDCLAERVKGKVDGRVYLNGEPLRHNQFKFISTYVQQEDALYSSLTVKESLMCAARLYLPNSGEHEKMVTEVIHMLGLTKQEDVMVGGPFFRGLSGGQKRRLSIGVEVISRPSVLFLDEPTSGLDSSATFALMEGLKELASKGTTIIATIHQPSAKVLNMSDKLLLLSGGRPAYFGRTQDALKHFSSLGYECEPQTNPADFFLDLINGDFHDEGEVEKVLHKYLDSEAKQLIDLQVQEIINGTAHTGNTIPDHGQNSFNTCFWRQTWVLCYRNLINLLRNPAVIWLRMGMYSALALLIGTIFLQLGYSERAVHDRVAVLFFIAAFMVFMSVSVLPSFIEERSIFVRERANAAYRVSAYSVANLLVSIPFIFLLALSSSLISYWLIGLNPNSERFFFFVLNLFLSLLCAESLMLLVAAIIPIFIVAIAAAAAVYGMFMLVCGFFVYKENIGWWWRWAYYISMHSYAFASFMDNDLSGLNFIPTNCVGNCTLISGEKVLADNDLSNINKWNNTGIIIAMVIIYRLLAFFIMVLFHKGKK